MKKCLLYLVLMNFFLLSACGNYTTSTLLPSPVKTIHPPPNAISPEPILTSISPQPTPTIIPIDGITTWQVNIRKGPATYFEILGQINKNLPVQINGKDSSSKWYAIIFPEDSEDIGWVSAEYIEVPGKESIPIIFGLLAVDGKPAVYGSLIQKVNIRNGPGVHYDSLGILPSGSDIWLLGRNESNSWFYIDYPPSPTGKGWVIAGFVLTKEPSTLPIVDSNGVILTPIATTVETNSEFTPIPIASFAPEDGDSFKNPGGVITFSPLATGIFIFSNDISTPQGDESDWIAFRPYSGQPGDASILHASLQCSGNGQVQLSLYENGELLSNWDTLACGDQEKKIHLVGGSEYILQIAIKESNESNIIHYSISLRNNP